MRGVKPRLGQLRREAAAGGFTLIELLVALTLTGFVVVLAHAVLAEVSDAAVRGRTVTQELDRAGNRRAWLRRAFANVTAGSGPLRGFEGRDGHDGPEGREADRMTFITRLPMDARRAERRVRLWLVADALLAELGPPTDSGGQVPDTLVIADGVRALGADFLVEYGANSQWVREWISPVSAPIAVRLRLQDRDGRVDTLLLHVGPRG